MLQLQFMGTILFFTRDILFFTLRALSVKYTILYPKAMQHLAAEPWHLERAAASAWHTQLGKGEPCQHGSQTFRTELEAQQNLTKRAFGVEILISAKSVPPEGCAEVRCYTLWRAAPSSLWKSQDEAVRSSSLHHVKTPWSQYLPRVADQSREPH